MIESLNLDKRIEELKKAENKKVEKERDIKARKSLESILQRNAGGIEYTALAAIKMHMYNFLIKNPKASNQEIEIEFKKINRLSILERKYEEEKKLLPTIGIEIEIPHENLTYSKVNILNKLNIPNHEESEELQEVNPNFSYSPQVQARILQELIEMNAIPLEKDEKKNQRKIDNYVPLSLHVNFGMPAFVDSSTMRYNTPNIVKVNEILTYAFSSTNRLEKRKTSTSYNFEGDAQESEKNINEEGVHNLKLMRLELRAGEFKDYTAYRMLAEGQRLVAMLIILMKNNNGFELSQKESRLFELWGQFDQEVAILFKEFDLRPQMIDRSSGAHEVIETLDSTELRKKCRKIATKYSLEVAKTLKMQDETEDI